MINKNSPEAWFLAIRPKTLTASATPVVIACALAYRDKSFQWKPALICFLFAIMAQVVSNLANDYFDYKKGIDNEERLGPKRATAEGWITPKAMLFVTLALLILDMALGSLLLHYGGWKLIFVGLFVTIFAFAYSGGPYPLAYHGLGDICVFIFFGIIPVGFTYYVQTLQWNISVTVCGASVGLAIINILVANNYRDRFTDAKSGKKTSIVLFGEKFGKWFYLFNGIVAVVGCQYFWLEKSSWAALLPILYLIFHIHTWREMITIHKGKALIGVLERTARNVLIFGVLLSIGLIL
jgi:1,4-dihydroxy-2-naphthoate octaprenyltransferase